MTTTALLCESCAAPCPTGTATVRTTLTPAGLTPVAWCRTCRPVVRGRIGSVSEHTAENDAGRCCPGAADTCPAPGCDHEWLDRPESDSRECLICGTEVFG